MILQTVLLIDEQYVKEFSTVSENFEEKYINPCIVKSQVEDLQALIGTPLSVKLCELVDDETITDTENAAYADLLDGYVRPYLLACTQSEILISNMAKIRNAGNMTYVDVNQQNISIKDMQYLHQHYADSATFLGNRLTEWLKCNIKQFPEYARHCDCCNGMQPDPKSSLNIGLVL